ncbi:polysaccharide deacetylase [Lucifera butyrica]|uniref:Polysaccharide deacetylase n=1 Tax=Lucifera butyrica TaxID=1351585 RepID=A0A498RA74_9FIRM|nr:polysaccharide deacetylase family protein [Lucifera butyrica]VBB08291.1 polysaccharide deacetylase [Lucifera butyrica]
MLNHTNEFFGIIFLSYAILPTVAAHCLHIGVYWQGDRKSEKVALTFDDGPDPVYTPQILDILNKYNARATFFVVGKHAEKYPDLVRRIISEGHTLGIHGYRHRFAWLLDPVSSIQEIKKGNEVIRKIIGNGPFLFRPAWGVFNLCSLIYLWLSQEKAILWSFFARDWETGATSDSIFNHVICRIKPGSVVVFHDRCTKPWAVEDGPAKTIQALPEILESIQTRGLDPVPVEDLLEFKENGEILLGYREI